MKRRTQTDTKEESKKTKVEQKSDQQLEESDSLSSGNIEKDSHIVDEVKENEDDAIDNHIAGHKYENNDQEDQSNGMLQRGNILCHEKAYQELNLIFTDIDGYEISKLERQRLREEG